MIISLDAEKGLLQNSTPLHHKGREENRHTRNIPKHNKAIYSKQAANIKLNEEKHKAISLKSEIRQGCPLSPYPFYIVLEILVRAMNPSK